MKAKKIRLYYGIFLSVFTCVLGAVFIALAVTTFAGGFFTRNSRAKAVPRFYSILFLGSRDYSGFCAFGSVPL